MSAFEESKKILDGVRHENMSVEWKLAKAQSLALLAVAEALAGAGEPEKAQDGPTPVYALTMALKGGDAIVTDIYSNYDAANTEASRLNTKNDGPDVHFGVSLFHLKGGA